jgi:hypothetical protein
MLDLIQKVIDFIISFWKALPSKTKEKIINLIVDAFDDYFRRFYKSHQNKA